jgi:CHAD domain-containing protein
VVVGGAARREGTDAVATTVRETERKYESPEALDPALVEQLMVTAGGTARAERVVELSAVYHDTEDLRLARFGVTLRRRRGGDDAGWHLKLPAGEDSRDEVRLPPNRARKAPGELVALTRALHRGAPLVPVAALDTRRREWLVTASDGRPLVTVTDDRVTAHTLGEETDAVSWSEVEIELAPDEPPELLDRLEAELARAGIHRSASSSKLGRLLAGRLPPPAPRPRADAGSTAGAAVLAYLVAQADAIRTLDPLVRQDAPDAVHRMRVACRRLRSVLQACRPLLAGELPATVVAELRWLAGELGAARDLEVLEERISATVSATAPELVLGPVAAQVTRYFQRRRAEAAGTATTALDSDRYLALLGTLDALLDDPPFTAAAGRPARRELPTHVRRSLRRVSRAYAAVHQHPPGAERDAAIHETRKAAKRLRYALEAAAAVLGKKAQRAVAAVKAVQSLLGEHQDSVVARPVLRDLGAGAHDGAGSGFTFGWLHRDELARAERVETELDAAWAELTARTAWLRT